MTPIVVSISEEGVCRFLVNESTESFLTDTSVIRRASHVEPVWEPARVLFHLLRRFFGEKGRVAAFTRTWPCLWQVNMAPIGGPVLSGEWRNRESAIDAEIRYLQERFI